MIRETPIPKANNLKVTIGSRNWIVVMRHKFQKQSVLKLASRIIPLSGGFNTRDFISKEVWIVIVAKNYHKK